MCQWFTIISLRTILHVFTTIDVNNGNLGSICVNVSLVQVWEPLYMFFMTMEVNNGNLGSICLNVSLLQVWEPFYMLLRQLMLKVVI